MAYFSTETAKREIIRIRFGAGKLNGWDKTQVITINITDVYDDYRQLNTDNFLITPISAYQAGAGEAEYDNVGGCWFGVQIYVQAYDASTGNVTVIYKQIPGSTVHRSKRAATEECWSEMTADLCIIP